jgi:hypothetical protein
MPESTSPVLLPPGGQRILLVHVVQAHPDNAEHLCGAPLHYWLVKERRSIISW